jgi:hypothetical protein
MIADSFNSRTLANMEVALDLACKLLDTGAEQHKTRRYIASRILARARQGDTSLGGLTEAGRIAASEICSRARHRPVARRGAASPMPAINLTMKKVTTAMDAVSPKQ